VMIARLMNRESAPASFSLLLLTIDSGFPLNESKSKQHISASPSSSPITQATLAEIPNQHPKSLEAALRKNIPIPLLVMNSIAVMAHQPLLRRADR
jgi:hypothetical protein